MKKPHKAVMDTNGEKGKTVQQVHIWDVGSIELILTQNSKTAELLHIWEVGSI